MQVNGIFVAAPACPALFALQLGHGFLTLVLRGAVRAAQSLLRLCPTGRGDAEQDAERV